jgi:hypothetical protein
MPLLLQALPLSFKTFWRYLAVLPILGIIAVLLLLASFIPVIGIFVPGTVYAYCIMTGLRCTLAARGHATDPGFEYLLRAGSQFCVLTMVATLILQTIAVLVPMGISGWFGWLDGLGNDDPRILLAVGGVFGLYTLFMLLWSAALAVPMTAAVVGSNRRSWAINPFDGIGAGMFSLTLISLVWIAGGTVFAIFGEVATMVFLLFETVRAVIHAEDPAWDWSVSPLSLLGGTLYMTWASSWFFATAVLVWERRVDRQKADAIAVVEQNRVSSADLRALREARMPRRDDLPRR